MLDTAAARTDLVRSSTVLEPVPFVEEIQLHTATSLLPIWRATAAWLVDNGGRVPFWCVPWAGGQGLARWILDHREAVAGKAVLDIGSGSGLVAIAAALAGAAHVRAVDLDPLAAAACVLNAEANGVTLVIDCADPTLAPLDEGAAPPDVILAGDVWYEATPAARLEGWLSAFVRRGSRVLTGDPGRTYVPAAVRELAVYAVPTSIELESAAVRTTRVLELIG